MLYSDEDKLNNKRRLASAWRLLFLCALPFLALAVAAFCLRVEPLCMLASFLFLASCLFVGDMKLVPLWRYGRFLKDVTTGLSHRTAGTLVRVGDDLVFEEGVYMRECILNVYEDMSPEGERRFLLDAAKALPDGLLGRDVALTSHGNAVLGVELMGAKA